MTEYVKEKAKVVLHSARSTLAHFVLQKCSVALGVLFFASKPSFSILNFQMGPILRRDRALNLLFFNTKSLPYFILSQSPPKVFLHTHSKSLLSFVSPRAKRMRRTEKWAGSTLHTNSAPRCFRCIPTSLLPSLDKDKL